MKTLKFVFKKENNLPFSKDEVNYFIIEKLKELQDFKKFLNEKFDEDLYIVIEKIIPLLFILSNENFKELELIIKNNNLFMKKIDNEIVIETPYNKINIYFSENKTDLIFTIRDINNCDFLNEGVEEKILII